MTEVSRFPTVRRHTDADPAEARAAQARASAMPRVTVRDLSVAYGAADGLVLDGVDLDLFPGDSGRA